MLGKTGAEPPLELLRSTKRAEPLLSANVIFVQKKQYYVMIRNGAVRDFQHIHQSRLKQSSLASTFLAITGWS
jgi:hypothetical protein